MAHFAKLDVNNNVIFVTVGRDEDDGKEAELSARTGDIYKQTSYNTYGGVHYNSATNQPSEDQSKAYRKNYAGVGFYYDAQRDAFIPPQPYPSWTLDDFSCLWVPPVPMPPGGRYDWDENSGSWVPVDQ